MRLSGVLLLLLVFFIEDSQCENYNGAKWHCGINSVTETISEWLAKPFDYHGVNQCCHAHDEHYYHQTLSREDADTVFCNCLDQNANWFVRNLIEPVFCKSVQAYNIWQKVTNQEWVNWGTTTTTTTTTTTRNPYNFYLELLRQRELEAELAQQERAQRLKELEAENEKLRRDWFFLQQYNNQRKDSEWNL